MKKQIINVCAVLVAVLFLSFSMLELNAHARAGSSRSIGSRGTRSYSAPATSPSQTIPPRQQATPAPASGRDRGGYAGRHALQEPRHGRRRHGGWRHRYL